MHFGSAYNPAMLLSKPLLLIFSFLLCFCLFSKQADYISNSYCDVVDATDVCHVLNAMDGTHMETDDRFDFNEPFILPEAAPSKIAPFYLFNLLAGFPYIPPPIPHALRPPLQ